MNRHDSLPSKNERLIMTVQVAIQEMKQRLGRSSTLNFKEGLTMRRIYALGLAIALLFLTATSIGFAANYDFKEMTPEIKKALKDRQTRYAQIQDFKKEGVIGENNKGYVTNLKDGDSTAGALASAENSDRRVIYEALAEQNKLGGAGLLEVQRAFAEVQDGKAALGEMVQTSSGDWKKKS